MGFDENLNFGKTAEGLIATWLKARGNAVMPAYEVEINSGKGPQLFTAEQSLVAPDLLVFNHGKVQWIESKHKSVFTWHRLTQQWTTGIDLRHYKDYLHVSKQTLLPVWLLFFHRNSTPSKSDIDNGCPVKCPTGLFGGELFELVAVENHRSPALDRDRNGCIGHGKSGMVYWSANKLKKLADVEQVIDVYNAFHEQQPTVEEYQGLTSWPG